MYYSTALQPSKPLLRIVNLREAGIAVFPGRNSIIDCHQFLFFLSRCVYADPISKEISESKKKENRINRI
ncbi:hypothetical protein ACFLRX_10270 [Acidobacteriota bacterium]